MSANAQTVICISIGKSIFLPKNNPSLSYHMEKVTMMNILHLNVKFILLSGKLFFNVSCFAKETVEHAYKLLITSHEHDVAHVANCIAL